MKFNREKFDKIKDTAELETILTSAGFWAKFIESDSIIVFLLHGTFITSEFDTLSASLEIGSEDQLTWQFENRSGEAEDTLPIEVLSQFVQSQYFAIESLIDSGLLLTSASAAEPTQLQFRIFKMMNWNAN